MSLGSRILKRALKAKRLREFVKRSKGFFRRNGGKGIATKGIVEAESSALVKTTEDVVRIGGTKALAISPTKGANTAGIISRSGVGRYFERKAGIANPFKKNLVKEAEIVTGGLESAIVTKNPSAFRKLLTKGGKFGLSLAGWSIGGYYFDKAIDYMLNEGEYKNAANLTKEQMEKRDAEEAEGKNALEIAHNLAEAAHGYAAAEEQIATLNTDLSSDLKMAKLISLLIEGISKPQATIDDLGDIFMQDVAEGSIWPLFLTRLCDSVKTIMDASGVPNLSRLHLIQQLASDDEFVVSPTGLNKAYTGSETDVLMNEDVATDHLGAVSSFIDEYRQEAMVEIYKDLTDAVQIKESRGDLYDKLSSGEYARQLSHLKVLGSTSHDRFEDTLSMLAEWRVDDDGKDDESAMLDLIFSHRQPSTRELNIIINNS